MDIAKAFEILSNGKIISSNSKKHSELVNMLLNDDFFEDLKNLLDKIGYRLIAQDEYFFISKKLKLSSSDEQNFITKHKDMILSIAFLRQLYPRIDKGTSISFLNVASSYESYKKEDNSILKKLQALSFVKNKEDEKEMLEQLFRFLEDKALIEKENENSSDRFRILNAISYYLSIVESVEKDIIDA